MNTTTYSDNLDDRQSNGSSHADRRSEPHLVVQILSVIAFGVFGIVAISMAFHASWVAGLFLTAMIVWAWSGSRTFGGRNDMFHGGRCCSINDLKPDMFNERTSGNSSFDSHRAEMMQRLEQESRDFEDFLTNLRQASDAKEFDQFMRDRAAKGRHADDDNAGNPTT